VFLIKSVVLGHFINLLFCRLLNYAQFGISKKIAKKCFDEIFELFTLITAYVILVEFLEIINKSFNQILMKVSVIVFTEEDCIVMI
jgi:hypothetical protein